MLIRNAEINFTTVTDIRIANGVVVEIGMQLQTTANDIVLDAHGNALLPGLHDHHLHFMAYAAALDSVFCGPPTVNNEAELVQALQQKAQVLSIKPKLAQSNHTWLRGIGYHASVVGEIDRSWLDRIVPNMPVRIQQRSGRLWILNSCALSLLGDLSVAPLEKINGELSGRLYDADRWLRERIGQRLPDVARASRRLASFGVTGFTDTSPQNDAATFEKFSALQQCGELLQDVVLMGDASLSALPAQEHLRCGATKIHLHDSALPDFDELCTTISVSHRNQRPVAIHCVTLTELLFSLNAIEIAGALLGDRIEHAAIAPPEVVQKIKQLNLIVVTQPNFIAERGDAYLRDVDADDRPWLYRLRGFIDDGIALAAGTDTPFGDANPWAAMQAAVTRCTSGGAIIGAQEALTPEAALELFLGDPLLPGQGRNRIEIGCRANLCMLDRSWQHARKNLAGVWVIKTIKNGFSLLD